MRINDCPGYRVYCFQYGLFVVVLLCGGDKSTQAKDIAKAKEYVAIRKEEYDG